jgi:hypothetical protein
LITLCEKNHRLLSVRKLNLFYFRRHEIEKSSETKGSRMGAIDISVALIILKARHRLSNKCLSDILKLLQILRVPHLPSSWWACKKLACDKSSGHLRTKKRSICPSCEKTSEEVNNCNQCDLVYDTIIPKQSIPIFYLFNISLQLKSILLHTPDLVFQDLSLPPPNTMHDIIHGSYYWDRLKQETVHFITLTMNIDGVQPNKGSDNSIWPVLMVVNEIRRKKRFSLENLILAGVWPGPKKPSRDDMAIFLRSRTSVNLSRISTNLFYLFSYLTIIYLDSSIRANVFSQSYSISRSKQSDY